MPLQTLDFKPGIDKEGTDYSAKGGWVDGNLIRFRKGRVEKVGGWLKLGSNYYLGTGRALHSWISLGGVRYLGIGSTWKYYIEEGNSYYDITPIRATTSAGDVTFGATNGSSTITVTDTAHGAANDDSASSISAVNQLRLWTHDNYGENLIINPRGAGIYEWIENDGVSTRAVNLSTRSGANLVPTVALQVITSETDRHLVVLGADPINSSNLRSNVIDPMLVAFSDQENELDFEPTATNTAGSLRLSSGSFIVGGIKSRQEILIFTDTSLYSMNFIGPPLTFAINLINEGSGLLSPKSAVNAPNGVFYASKTGFYFYSGSVKRLPCTVQEYVFEDLDLDQAFKCHMGVNTEFSEIWFFYPSLEDGTGEISRYVIYNYEENHWSVGSLIRYAWLDVGIEDLPYATATSSSQQCIFQHETGFDDNQDAMTNVFIESADLDIASGDSFTFVKKIIPDMKFVTQSGVSVDPAMNILSGRFC